MGSEFNLVEIEKIQNQSEVEVNTANKIKEAFQPMLDGMATLEDEFNTVMSLEFSEEKIQQSRELRLKFRKVRTDTKKIHESEKKKYLVMGRVVDAIKNLQEGASLGKEESLAEVEKHYENLEKERILKIKDERTSELEKIEAEVIPGNLGEMSENVWTNYISGQQLVYKNKKEAEKKAAKDEEDRIEEERVENERIRKENEEFKKKEAKREETEKALDGRRRPQLEKLNLTFIPDNLGTMSEDHWEDYLLQAKNKFEEVEEQRKNDIIEEEKREAEKVICNERKAELLIYNVVIFPENLGSMTETYWKEHLLSIKTTCKKNKDAAIKAADDQKKKDDLEKELQDIKDRDAADEIDRLAEVEREAKKGDGDKALDIIKDLEEIRGKYSFKSKKNQKMFTEVQAKLTDIIIYIQTDAKK